jgi:hypothetical protein
MQISDAALAIRWMMQHLLVERGVGAQSTKSGAEVVKGGL